MTTTESFHANLSFVSAASEAAPALGLQLAAFTEYRGIPVLPKADNYRFSTVRFKTVGLWVPAALADIVEGGTDPNRCVWRVGLSYGFTAPSGARSTLARDTHVEWETAVGGATPPSPDANGVYSRGAISANLESPYYWAPNIAWIARLFTAAWGRAAAIVATDSGTACPLFFANAAAGADARPIVGYQATPDGVTFAAGAVGTTINVPVGSNLATHPVRLLSWLSLTGGPYIDAPALAPYVSVGTVAAVVAFTLPDPLPFTNGGGTYSMLWTGPVSGAVFGVSWTSATTGDGEATFVGAGGAGIGAFSYETGDRVTIVAVSTAPGGGGGSITAYLNEDVSTPYVLGNYTVNETFAGALSATGGTPAVTAPFVIGDVIAGASAAAPVLINALGVTTNTVSLSPARGSHVFVTYAPSASITLGPTDASSAPGTASILIPFTVKQNDGSGAVGGYGGGPRGVFTAGLPTKAWAVTNLGVTVKLTPTGTGSPATAITADITCDGPSSTPLIYFTSQTTASTGVPWRLGSTLRIDSYGTAAIFGLWAPGADTVNTPPYFELVHATAFLGTGGGAHTVTWTATVAPWHTTAGLFLGASIRLSSVGTGTLVPIQASVGSIAAIKVPPRLSTLPGNSGQFTLFLDGTAFPYADTLSALATPGAASTGWAVTMNAAANAILAGFPAFSTPTAAPGAPARWTMYNTMANRVLAYSGAMDQTTTTPDGWLVTAEYPSGDILCPVSAIAFTTAMPVVFEQDSPPIVTGGEASSSANTVTNYTPAFTDIALPLSGGPTDYRQAILYLPTAQFRWVRLTSALPLREQSVSIFWRCRHDAVLRPVYLQPAGSIEMKQYYEKLM